MKCTHPLVPRESATPNPLENAENRIGETVHICVYDGFEGDVKIISTESEKVLVKILSIDRAFNPELYFSVGDEILVEDWLV